MRDFWLVQRMNRGVVHNGPITKPKHLKADYMGSAEFEFGAIPKAYQAMQSQKLTQTTITVKAFDTESTFHVIAPVDQVDSLQERFQAWFDSGLHSKENPYLERIITRNGWFGEPMSDEEFERLPIAWWALREKIFFTLDESIARMWLDNMSTTETTLPESSPMNIL